MIPKRIYSIWISEKDLPELMINCVKTHSLPDYEHSVITLENCYKGNRYLLEAIGEKKWIKVTDYLRIYYLYKYGGIYLDCDMEVLKTFDDLLGNNMFVGREDPDVIANSVIGAEQGHKLLETYLKIVDDNYRGDGDLVFEQAERLFSDLVIGRYGNFSGVTTYSHDYFFPLDEKTKIVTKTNNTHIFHHFSRTWKIEGVIQGDKK